MNTKIDLTRINGIGFMSFKKEFDLDLSPYFGKVVQIDGENKDDELSKSNGSGKSTLLEAIGWGLYGELCRKNKYNDEVINKEENKAFVWIYFNIKNIEYSICRMISRKKSNGLHIYKDNEEILKGSTYQIKQQELEKLLSMNFTAFQCSEMLGSNFMNFPDLKSLDRARILSDIRGLGKYLEASKRASDTAKSMGINLDSIVKELHEKETISKTVVSTSYETDIEQWEKERNEDITDFEVQLIDLQKQLEKEKEEVQTKIIELQGIILKEKQEIVTLNSKKPSKEVENKYIELTSTLSKLQVNITYKKEELKKVEEKITKWKNKKEGNCPYCNQVITGKLLTKHIQEEEKGKPPLDKKLSDLNIEWKKVQEERKVYDNQKQLIKEIEEKIINIENLIREREYNIKTLKLNSKEKQLIIKIENIQERILQEQKSINPFLEKEKERVKKIQALNIEIEKLKKETLEIENVKKYYDIWIDGFKKIRLSLFKTMVDKLENLANEYLSKYSSELQIIIKTENETRSGTIRDELYIGVIDSNGIEMSYEMYSGGERQKVRLSIARALTQFIKDSCGVEFNFIAFDEPNDALDDVGKEINFETFQELSEEGKLVLVTDHDSLFKDKFDEVIKVIKENGVSNIYG